MGDVGSWLASGGIRLISLPQSPSESEPGEDESDEEFDQRSRSSGQSSHSASGHSAGSTGSGAVSNLQRHQVTSRPSTNCPKMWAGINIGDFDQIDLLHIEILMSIVISDKFVSL